MDRITLPKSLIYDTQYCPTCFQLVMTNNDKQWAVYIDLLRQPFNKVVSVCYRSTRDIRWCVLIIITTIWLYIWVYIVVNVTYIIGIPILTLQPGDSTMNPAHIWFATVDCLIVILKCERSGMHYQCGPVFSYDDMYRYSMPAICSIICLDNETSLLTWNLFTVRDCDYEAI